MKNELIIGTVLMGIGCIMGTVGLCIPEIYQVAMAGVKLFMCGAIVLFVTNIQQKHIPQLSDDELLKYKKVFDRHIEPFIQEKLVHKIYESEKLCVCNVANLAYYIFPYQNIKYHPIPMGTSFGKEIIEQMIDNYEYVIIYMANVGEDYIKQYSITLNDNALEIVRKIKAEREVQGPSNLIDFDWEERIKEKIVNP